MGYVPLSKPQTGVRQFGVDLAAIGKSPVDGVDEMLLFVIKRGDIGRRDWDNGEPTSVRPSLNEVLDVYLTKLVAPEHATLRKTVVLATTGDIKQDVETNWTAYKEQNAGRASFDFWGGDRVADLIESYMLDEHLFAAADRSDLRRALALAGDVEYDLRDLKRLLLRQLGLKPDGSLGDAAVDAKALGKALRRVHLASQICVHWAQVEEDSRQALSIAEITLLWAWHRVLLLAEESRPQLFQEISEIWHSYTQAAHHYFDVVQPHMVVQDGMAGYSGEGSEFAIVLFEHIGLMATIGLSCRLEPADDEEHRRNNFSNADVVAKALCALISNNPASASPRLDGHAIDIGLALMFLVITGRVEEAKAWLAETAKRLDYCFQSRKRFPVASDSLEDLVALEVNPGDTAKVEDLMNASWCLATIAAWCVILGLDEHYLVLSRNSEVKYPNVCAQLWHPSQGWPAKWYFGGALDSGDAEAPYALLGDVTEMRKRMSDFLQRDEYDWVASSPSRAAGLWPIDLIACRHFRMPVPASAWYRLGQNQRQFQA